MLKEGKKFARTIHVLWGPDEELGGGDGMKKFVQTQEFRNLKIGFALDEGLASEDDTYKVYYAERNVWCEFFYPFLLTRCLFRDQSERARDARPRKSLSKEHGWRETGQ